MCCPIPAARPRKKGAIIVGVSDERDVSRYSVRCVFAVGRRSEAVGETYEERITLWSASSAERAIEPAEAEALEYATAVEGCTYLGLAQSYQLADDVGDSAEVFSLMRDSELEPKEYLDVFFDVGTEHQTTTT